MPLPICQSKWLDISHPAQPASARAGTIVRYQLQRERPEEEEGEGIMTAKAKEAAEVAVVVAEAVMKTSNSSTALTPKTTLSRSPTKI